MINAPLLASGPAVTDDTRTQWASLAIHRDAELLFCSKKSGATLLAARCCHVAAESQSLLQHSWFECCDRVVHFANDHISSIEVLRHSSEKEKTIISRVDLRNATVFRYTRRFNYMFTVGTKSVRLVFSKTISLSSISIIFCDSKRYGRNDHVIN